MSAMVVLYSVAVQSQRKFEFGIKVYDEVIQICTQDKKVGFVVFFSFSDFPE